MTTRQYDPTRIVVSIAGAVMQGYADGEFVSLERDSDAFTDVVGTDGEVSRSKTSDNRATVKIMLMQTSPSNDALSALINLDKITPGGAGVFTFLLQDLEGRTLHRASEAWVSKSPPVKYDRGPTSREWTIRCANLESFDGGN